MSAETRAAAIDRLHAALQTYPILGIRTNVPFLLRLIDLPDFRAGRLHTGFIDEHAQILAGCASPAPAALAAAALAPRAMVASEPAATAVVTFDPWSTLGGWGR